MNEKHDNRDIGKMNADHLFTSKELDHNIKNLSAPRFLGSVHMKKNALTNISSTESLLNNELELKMSRSLKSMFFNPITKALILLMLIFNLVYVIWYLF